MAIDPAWRANIEALIRDAESNLGKVGGADPGNRVTTSSQRAPMFPPRQSTNTAGGAADKYALRREVASIQNHIRSELQAQVEEMRHCMDQNFEQHKAEVNRKIMDLRCGHISRSTAGLSSSDGSASEQHLFESRSDREYEHDDRHGQSKQDLRSEIRSAQNAVLTHVSAVEADFKRQIQQVDASTRELRSQIRDSNQSTQDQVESIKGQSSALLAQFKRSTFESQQTADAQAVRLKHAMAEQEAMSATLRQLEREMKGLEAGQNRNPASRYYSSDRQNEDSVLGPDLRAFIENRIELETNRTTSACEKMLTGASSQVASERSARLELGRTVQRIEAQVDSLQMQYDQDLHSLQRRLSDFEALQAQETNLREEAENSMLTQQKMAALRLEEFLTLRISSELDKVTAEVASLKHAAESTGSTDDVSVDKIVTSQIENCVAKLDGFEREQTTIRHQLSSVNEKMESVQSAGKAALNFDERNRVINAKFRDMVAVCGNVIQEAERTQKELLTQRSEQEQLKQGVSELTSRVQDILESMQVLQSQRDAPTSSLSRSAVQALEERLAILEAESTIRRQQRILSDPTLVATGDEHSGLSSDAFESRILIQVRVLEEKLLGVLKEEDTILQGKVDSIHKNLQRESAERVALGSTLSARMEDRIKSLADVIDTATSEAVKEMSTLFEPEMQRLRQQFDASHEALVSAKALDAQVQSLLEGQSLPDGLRHQLELLMTPTVEQLQTLQADFRSMKVSHVSKVQPDRQRIEHSLDQTQKAVDAKLAGFDRALTLQQENRQLLEEQVFSLRRSVPVVDRLAKSMAGSLERHQNAEVEIASLKKKLTEERQDAASVIDTENGAFALLEQRLLHAEARLDQTDASVTNAIRSLKALEGGLDQVSSQSITHRQLQKVDDELMRLAAVLHTLKPPAIKPQTSRSISDGSFTEPASSLDQSVPQTDVPIGKHILEEITKIEQKWEDTQKRQPESTDEPLSASTGGIKRGDTIENHSQANQHMAQQMSEEAPREAGDLDRDMALKVNTAGSGRSDTQGNAPSSNTMDDHNAQPSRPVITNSAVQVPTESADHDSEVPVPAELADNISIETDVPPDQLSKSASGSAQGDEVGSSGAGGSSGSGQGDWLSKLTESVNSLEAVLSSDDTNGVPSGTGADTERLQSDEEDEAPTGATAVPPPAAFGPKSTSFSFALSEDASDEEGVSATAVVPKSSQAANTEIWDRSFDDTFSFD